MLAALLLVLMGMLGSYIAYWISSTGLAYWRAVAGFAVAFMFAWVGGVVLSASVFAMIGAVNIAAITTSFLGQGFWFALVGAGYGVYKGRVKIRSKVRVASINRNDEGHPHPQVANTNDHYAEALAEIEEGRLDKGVWARAFAEAGGDEPKAKALYIKARAEAMKGAEVWENTQPPELSDAGIKARGEKATVELDNPAPIRTPKWPIWIVAGALPVYFVVSLAVSAFKANPSGQVEAEARTGSQPMKQASSGAFSYEDAAAKAGSQPMAQVSPEQSDWGKSDKPTQTAPGWGDKDAMATPAKPNLVPFNGKLDDAPSTSAQSDNDKAMKEHFRLVYAAHPDIEAVLASAGFRAWLVKYPAYERIVVKGTAPEVIGMLNTYKKQNQLPGAAAQSPNAFYKCNGPSGVLYQATPCGTASN